MNIPWVVDAPAPDLYGRYNVAFSRACDVGFDTFRVWAAPWEIPYGSTPEEYVTRRVEHFATLAALAKRHGAAVVVCLLLHIEFLSRDVRHEIRDVRHAWPGHPLNVVNGGRFRQPTEIFDDCGTAFSCEYLAALAAALPTGAVVELELMNEIDRVTGYQRERAAKWSRLCQSVAAKQRRFAKITLSCADPFEMLALSRLASLDHAGVHIHGWPDSDLCRSVMVVGAAFERAGQSFHITEISPDAETAPAGLEATNWVAGIVLPTFTTGACGHPWWWEALDRDEGMRDTLRAAFRAMRGHEGSVEIHISGRSKRRLRVIRRLTRRRRLILRPAMWRRLMRQLWLTHRYRGVNDRGPWSIRSGDGAEIVLSRGQRERPKWKCIVLDVDRR